ncbi:MAG: DNA mismatch repair protein MutS [Actinomycetota bacterium]|nr:DNA mismatch repair protein MutS [Actinomycetota bacterium]
MTFRSLLFLNFADRPPEERHTAPDFFGDLELDRIVATVTAGKEEYNLRPFFYLPLHDADAVLYRQEVMQDLEGPALSAAITTFAAGMRTMRGHLAQSEKLREPRQQERWHLEATVTYCQAVTRLNRELAAANPASRGLSAFRQYLAGYTASEDFQALLAQTNRLQAGLAAIRYCLLIDGLTVSARPYQDEPDYGAEIEATFKRFKHGAVKSYSFEFGEMAEMNHVEARILNLVVQLYPELFAELTGFCAARKEFQDPTLATFDRESQFFIAYLEHIAPCRKAGLCFCYPRLVVTDKEVYDEQCFDLALAAKLIGDHALPVVNDFHLQGEERIIVVTGPNQGGKTTFARLFGQLHYLASLGCPVPGAKAQFFLCDRLFTHFEREEHTATLRGKLQDDLLRIHAILEAATPRSIVIINEIFASTTFRDALLLSRRIAAKLMQLDLLAVWVTFLDEISSLGEKTTSMTSMVDPENPALRTYKIVRRPADGLAYAMAIADKHRLTYDLIKERISV